MDFDKVYMPKNRPGRNPPVAMKDDDSFWFQANRPMFLMKMSFLTNLRDSLDRLYSH